MGPMGYWYSQWVGQAWGSVFNVPPQQNCCASGGQWGGGMGVYVGGAQGTLPMGVLGSQTSGPSYLNSCMPNSSNIYPQGLPILLEPFMHVALTSQTPFQQPMLDIILRGTPRLQDPLGQPMATPTIMLGPSNPI
jgi:hypothetical protein